MAEPGGTPPSPSGSRQRAGHFRPHVQGAASRGARARSSFVPLSGTESGTGGEDIAPDLAAYVDKVALHAYKVTDEDLAALQRAGNSDDVLFETTVSAALGAALGRLERGLSALRGEASPPDPLSKVGPHPLTPSPPGEGERRSSVGASTRRRARPPPAAAPEAHADPAGQQAPCPRRRQDAVLSTGVLRRPDVRLDPGGDARALALERGGAGAVCSVHVAA